MHSVTPPLRRWFGAGLLSLLVGGWSAGCVHVEQTLALRPDGSGTLSLRYGMAESDLAEMESLARQQLAEEGLAPDAVTNPFQFDEAEVRKDFEAYRELGVTLEAVRSETVAGWKYLDLRIAFKTLAGLGQTEFLSDRQITLKKTGEHRYELVQAAPPGADAGDLEIAPELMADMMKGFRAVLRVQLPGSVVESNADEQEAAAAAWIFDVDRDAKALQRAQRLAMRVVFEGPGLELPEYAGGISQE